MLENIEGRADSVHKKHEVTQRLFRAWQRMPEQRLAQLLYNALPIVSFYNTEDFALVAWVEAFVDRNAIKKSE